ncbi:hypothetical protein BDB01DRAFT_846258 [Pilobolus umbonatus]|nr:hypothetical protein BDB01DRAFT_846258 [Pilobolus umbonatus]
MARPRSDIGRLQYRDQVDTKTTSYHFCPPKESQMKSIQFGLINNTTMCPTRTAYKLKQDTGHLRLTLATDHTFFLSYLDCPEKVNSIRPATISYWIKQHMPSAVIDTEVHLAHTIRAASSAKFVDEDHTINKVKQHVNWSLNTNKILLETINHAENSTTLEGEVEATGIVLGTKYNYILEIVDTLE